MGQNGSIPFFSNFSLKYSATMPDADIVFTYLEVSDSKDPFAINPNIVFFNREIWNKIGFTDEELEAMLAHEIGHAVDTLTRTKDNQQERENNADGYVVDHNLGGYLCSALLKCITSGIYSDHEVEGMQKRIIRIHYERLNPVCFLLRGIHSEPKNEWLIAVSSHWDEIKDAPYVTDRIRILKDLASHIDGIGPATIDETLTWFDL